MHSEQFRSRNFVSAVAVVFAVAAGVLVGVAPSGGLAASAATTTATTTAATNNTGATFVSLLVTLPTDNATHSGYARSQFKVWSDFDHDGCDTRAEVLMDESTGPVTHGKTCALVTGNWLSRYDNITFTLASKLDVDHMVPLAEAWQSGAFAWSSDRKKAFGNDLGFSFSLIGVSSSTNRSKSDRDPAQWMPPYLPYRCTYAAAWVAVKYRWNLSVDSAERTYLNGFLPGCGALNVPVPAKA